MYDPLWLNRANGALWTAVAARLRAAGRADVPDRLERDRPLDALRRDPHLVLAQTCGYPLVAALRDAVAVVARPLYGWPGCEDGFHRSFVVVRALAPFRSIPDLKGCRAAVNAPDSNTGMNLFRHAVAPFAEDGRFFGAVRVTGAHLASMEAVQEGDADTAAIDCVTFGLAARHRPALAAGLRVLAETTRSPALPFVTAGGTAPETVALLKEALAGAIADPTNRETVAALGLRGIESAALADYAVLLDLERQTARMGYPVLA